MGLNLVRNVIKAPGEILGNLYVYRHILSQMVKREIKGRFAGSMGGLLWHFVHPILMLLIFLFLFVYIFKLRVSTTGGAGTSAIYLMAGLFPWMILAEGLSRGTSSLIENAALIQKTFFPTEILTAKAVIAPFLSYGVAILLLAAHAVVFGGHIGIILALPLILLLQVLFTLGMTFLSATISVFFRDMMQLVQIVVSFWAYVTPIFYPLSMLPGWARSLMYLNPLFPFVANYQSLFLEGRPAPLHVCLLAFAWSFSVFVFGAFIFNKLRYEFADWL